MNHAEKTIDLERRIGVLESLENVAGSIPALTSSFVTLATSTELTNERVLTAGRRMAQTDAGAGSTITYRVVDTHHLIVDAAGYGDYTTIQAALTYIEGVGGSWDILLRTGTYAERLSIAPLVANTSYIVIRGEDDYTTIATPLTTGAGSSGIVTGVYAELILHDIKFSATGTATNQSSYISIAGNLTCYHCTIEPLPNQRLVSGNSSSKYYHCTLGAAGTTYVYGLVGSGGTSTQTTTLYNCLVAGGSAAGKGHVVAQAGNSIYLLHTHIANTGAGYDIYAVGNVYVGRSLYTRTNTYLDGGTITVLDGDMPALTAAIIPAAGSNTQIQYNNSGYLGADADFTFTAATNTVGIDNIQFDLTPTPTSPAEGLMYWNTDDGTINVGMPGGNVNLQLGQEGLIRVKNETGSPITNGQLVYISSGTGSRPIVSLAKADAEATSAPTIAMATETIADGHTGYCTAWGYVRDVNTNAYTPGTVLYLSATSAGGYTSDKTSVLAPNHLIVVGVVIKQSATEGIIYVSIDNGSELDELHDVLITAPIKTNALLAYDGTTWINTANALTIPADGTAALMDYTNVGNFVASNSAGAHYLKAPAGIVGIGDVDGDNLGTLITVNDSSEEIVITGSYVKFSNLSPSSLFVTDGSNYLSSVANAAGYLTNDGAGNFTYSATAAIGTPGTLTSTTVNDATAPHTHAITGAAWLAVANTFTTGAQTIQTGADATKGLIAKGNSATQSAHLIEAQNSGGTAKFAVGPTGAIAINDNGTASADAQSLVTLTSTNTALTAYKYAVSGEIRLSNTGANAGKGIIGLQYTASWAGTAANTSEVVGGRFYGQVRSTASAALTTLTGVEVQIQQQSTSGGSVSSAKALYVNAPTTTGAITSLYGLYMESQTGATNNYAIYSLGGQSYHAGNLGLGNAGTAFAPSVQLHAVLNPATTDSILEIARYARNTSGTAAAGLGVSQTHYLESSTTADQLASTVSTLWTDPTHATRTSRYQIATTGPGYCATWGYNGVAGTALTVIANGAGDVTEGIAVQYVASEVTGTDTGGGVAYLEPGDSWNICSDATNVLTLACAADGSVTVQRTAGTDTFKVTLWMVWQ